MDHKDRQHVIKLLNDRNYQQASELLNRIRDNYPDDWIIYDGLACVETNLHKNYEEAKALLEKAKEKGLPLYRYHRILAEIYWPQGQQKEAILELEKAAEIEPSIENITTLASSLMAVDYEKAYSIWLELIHKDPNNQKAYSALSWIYGRRGDYTKALESAQTVLKINPDDTVALFYAGRASQDLGKYKDAIDYFLRAQIKGYKEDFAFFRNLAICFFEIKDYRRAIELSYKAFKLFPKEFENDEFPKYFKGHILWLCGGKRMNEESYEALNISLEIWPQDAVLLAYKAYFEMHYKKNYNLGKFYIEKALQSPPYSTDLLYEIKGSLLYDCMNSKEDGIMYLEKAVSLNRNSTNLVALASRLGEMDISRAKDLFHEVLQLEPDNIYALYGLAELFLREGNITEGLQLAKKCYENDRSNPKVMVLLAFSYYQNGEIQNALGLYQEAERSGYKDVEDLYLSMAYCYQKLESKKDCDEYAKKVLKINPKNKEAQSLITNI